MELGGGGWATAAEAAKATIAAPLMDLSWIVIEMYPFIVGAARRRLG